MMVIVAVLQVPALPALASPREPGVDQGSGCPNWDVDCDGQCTVADLARVGAYWGRKGAPGWVRADVNGDGVVNVADFGVVGAHVSVDGSAALSTLVVDRAVLAGAEEAGARGCEDCASCDVNCDGQCTTSDAVSVRRYWGQRGAPGWVRADVNGDGMVDIRDMGLVGGQGVKVGQLIGPADVTVTKGGPRTPRLPLIRANLDPTKLWPTGAAPERVVRPSKLGIGVYALHAGDDVLEELLRARPGVLVLQDPDVDFVRKVRYCFPSAFIVGRHFFAEQPLDNPEERGVAAADKVAEQAVPFKGLIDAWMSYNEPVGHNDYEGYRAYNRFQVAFAKRLQGHYKISAVAGNDPPGAVEPYDYPRYFADAILASDYFGLHAYGGPNRAALNDGDAAYFALRYRLVHRELLKAGIRDVAIVLTEVGRGEGWRGLIGEEAMADEYTWLAGELAGDEYMIGMAIFGIFRDGDWSAFNIRGTRIVDRIGQYQPPTGGVMR